MPRAVIITPWRLVLLLLTRTDSLASNADARSVFARNIPWSLDARGPRRVTSFGAVDDVWPRLARTRAATAAASAAASGAPGAAAPPRVGRRALRRRGVGRARAAADGHVVGGRARLQAPARGRLTQALRESRTPARVAAALARLAPLRTRRAQRGDRAVGARAVGVRAAQPARCARRLAPDVVSYNAAISACGKARQWGARSRVDAMRAAHAGPTSSRTRPRSTRAARARGRIARRAARRDARRGPRAQRRDVLDGDLGLRQAEEWARALALLDEMRAAGLEPNVVSYSAAMVACERDARWRACALLRACARRARARRDELQRGDLGVRAKRAVRRGEAAARVRARASRPIAARSPRAPRRRARRGSRPPRPRPRRRRRARACAGAARSSRGGPARSRATTSPRSRAAGRRGRHRGDALAQLADDSTVVLVDARARRDELRAPSAPRRHRVLRRRRRPRRARARGADVRRVATCGGDAGAARARRRRRRRRRRRGRRSLKRMLGELVAEDFPPPRRGGRVVLRRRRVRARPARRAGSCTPRPTPRWRRARAAREPRAGRAVVGPRATPGAPPAPATRRGSARAAVPMKCDATGPAYRQRRGHAASWRSLASALAASPALAMYCESRGSRRRNRPLFEDSAGSRAFATSGRPDRLAFLRVGVLLLRRGRRAVVRALRIAPDRLARRASAGSSAAAAPPRPPAPLAAAALLAAAAPLAAAARSRPPRRPRVPPAPRARASSVAPPAPAAAAPAGLGSSGSGANVTTYAGYICSACETDAAVARAARAKGGKGQPRN